VQNAVTGPQTSANILTRLTMTGGT
jgi:hypothetical protein